MNVGVAIILFLIFPIIFIVVPLILYLVYSSSGSGSIFGSSEPCPADYHVSDGACEPCPMGTFRSSGDPMGGSDTFCEPTGGLCNINEYVLDGECLSCPGGTRRDAGDISLLGNTFCEPIVCDTNHYVINNTCSECDSGYFRNGRDLANGDDTFCEPDGGRCLENYRVINNQCEPCPFGYFNDIRDPQNGEDTFCEPSSSLCELNYYVSNATCVACETGAYRNIRDRINGSDTSCQTREITCSGGVKECPTGQKNKLNGNGEKYRKYGPDNNKYRGSWAGTASYIDSHSGWTSTDNESSSDNFIQIDLSRGSQDNPRHKIIAIVTQGHKTNGGTVNTYKVKAGATSVNILSDYLQNTDGSDIHYGPTGNDDSDKKVWSYLKNYDTKYRYVRIYPQTWVGQQPSMRVDILTEDDKHCDCISENEPMPLDRPIYDTLSDSDISNQELCGDPALGARIHPNTVDQWNQKQCKGVDPDGETYYVRRYSSISDDDYSLVKSKLNETGSWSPQSAPINGNENLEEFIQIDLGQLRKVRYVVTQGDGGGEPAWTTEYKIGILPHTVYAGWGRRTQEGIAEPCGMHETFLGQNFMYSAHGHERVNANCGLTRYGRDHENYGMGRDKQIEIEAQDSYGTYWPKWWWHVPPHPSEWRWKQDITSMVGATGEPNQTQPAKWRGGDNKDHHHGTQWPSNPVGWGEAHKYPDIYEDIQNEWLSEPDVGVNYSVHGINDRLDWDLTIRDCCGVAWRDFSNLDARKHPDDRDDSITGNWGDQAHLERSVPDRTDLSNPFEQDIIDRLEYDVARKDGIVRSNGTIAPECGVNRLKKRPPFTSNSMYPECDSIEEVSSTVFFPNISTARSTVSCENYYIPPPEGEKTGQHCTSINHLSGKASGCVGRLYDNTYDTDCGSDHEIQYLQRCTSHHNWGKCLAPEAWKQNDSFMISEAKRGNYDNHTKKWNYVFTSEHMPTIQDGGILTRYIRIYPTRWVGEKPRMRVDVVFDEQDGELYSSNKCCSNYPEPGKSLDCDSIPMEVSGYSTACAYDEIELPIGTAPRGIFTSETPNYLRREVTAVRSVYDPNLWIFAIIDRNRMKMIGINELERGKPGSATPVITSKRISVLEDFWRKRETYNAFDITMLWEIKDLKDDQVVWEITDVDWNPGPIPSSPGGTAGKTPPQGIVHGYMIDNGEWTQGNGSPSSYTHRPFTEAYRSLVDPDLWIFARWVEDVLHMIGVREEDRGNAYFTEVRKGYHRRRNQSASQTTENITYSWETSTPENRHGYNVSYVHWGPGTPELPPLPTGTFYGWAFTGEKRMTAYRCLYDPRRMLFAAHDGNSMKIIGIYDHRGRDKAIPTILTRHRRYTTGGGWKDLGRSNVSYTFAIAARDGIHGAAIGGDSGYELKDVTWPAYTIDGKIPVCNNWCIRGGHLDAAPGI